MYRTSACYFPYDYLERTPSAWHIAVGAKSSRTRFYIDYPIVKPHFIQSDRLNIGVMELQIDGGKVQVYDRDKTICDCLHQKIKWMIKNIEASLLMRLKNQAKQEGINNRIVKTTLISSIIIVVKKFVNEVYNSRIII